MIRNNWLLLKDRLISDVYRGLFMIRSFRNVLNVRRDLGVRLVRRLGVWGLGVGLIGIISDLFVVFFL